MQLYHVALPKQTTNLIFCHNTGTKLSKVVKSGTLLQYSIWVTDNTQTEYPKTT